MHIPVNHQSLLGDFTSDFHEDEHHERMADSGSGEGSGDGAGSPVSSRGNGGCIRDRPVKVIPCPRCQSMNTKFCYYNNYSVNQPRHFCRNCQRYWTVGGTLRNVPVGGGSRKKTRTRSRSDAHPYGASPEGAVPSGGDVMLNASSCMQQLSMLPPALGFGAGSAFAAPAGSQLPFLQFALEQGGLFQHCKGPLAGLQEVPDLQSPYEVPQLVNSVTSSPMLNPNGFFLPEFSGSDALTSAMAKAGLWSSTSSVQQLQALTGGSTSPSWEPKATNPSSLLQQLSGYSDDRKTNPMSNATVLPQSWSSKHAAFWDTSLLQPPSNNSSRPMMHQDRLVPHNTSWDQNNVSPNGSNITSEDDRCLPSNCFSQYGHEDVVSQPWMGLQASDILFQ